MNPIKWLKDSGFGGKELLAVLLIGGGAVFHAAVLTPVEQRLSAFEHRIAELKRAGSRAELTGTRGGDPAAQLQRFYAFLKRDLTTTQWLARVYAIGEGAGVHIPSGDYSYPQPSSPRVRLFRMSFPVSGSYTQIRGFADSVLKEIPVASLDRIQFRRNRVDESTIEADVVITLYLLV